MIKKMYANIDVVTAAKKRIKNVFSNGLPVHFSLSGGKDSICLNDIMFKLCQSGEIDKSLLTIVFIDEEAIYPCIEKQVELMRKQWKSIGVEFLWFCIECRHYNCLNSLESEESFICWDSTKKDKWIRPMPKWAITNHPLFRPRIDTYQQFLERFDKGCFSIIGLRASESLQRQKSISSIKVLDKVYPAYDWHNSDVWRYILENNLTFPKAYIYMYQCGMTANKLRISQFFSIDTMGALVKMCEYYPGLFNKICEREENAYMAALYYDTELYRRQKTREVDNTDYKDKVLDLLSHKELFDTVLKQQLWQMFHNLVVSYSTIIENKHYKKIYNCLVAGDPKGRTYRAIHSEIFKDFNKKQE